MADARADHADPRPCEVCSSLPADIWANTGRGEYLPPAFDQLVRLDLGQSDELYVCPDCEAMFEWHDLPQYYGSGNNWEERLTRLNPAQAWTARALLDPDPGARDGAWLLERAFRVLSHDIVYNILRYRARRSKRAFSAFVAPLVARLTAESNISLFDAIESYCEDDRERLAEVIRLLDAGGPDISKGAQFLREKCVERLQRTKSGRG